MDFDKNIYTITLIYLSKNFQIFFFHKQEIILIVVNAGRLNLFLFLTAMNINKNGLMILVENIQNEPEWITSMDGQKVELVNDFLYLGAKIRNSEEDIATRKKKAWTACHSLEAVWKSDLRKDLKICLFTATVESVLLYGS